jgi:hypothetical protein
MMNKLPDSRLLRQRLDMFLNFPRGGLEVCGAVYPLVRECLDNRANQKALADMRMRSASVDGRLTSPPPGRARPEGEK